jgi:hypothetical protein
MSDQMLLGLPLLLVSFGVYGFEKNSAHSPASAGTTDLKVVHRICIDR